MSARLYIVSLYVYPEARPDPKKRELPLRRAVVGIASIRTVEAAIAGASLEIQAAVRAHSGTRFFIEHGVYRSQYIAPGEGMERFRSPAWYLVIGTVNEVLS